MNMVGEVVVQNTQGALTTSTRGAEYKIYLYRVVTTAVGPAGHEEVIQSPDMTGRPVGDLPWGSGWEGAVLHLDQPGLWCLDSQLK